MMQIVWRVEDGYAGKDRPHYTDIPDEDLVGMTQEEIEDYINSWVEEEFEQNISFSWEIKD